jgi:hypothetical protein
VHVTLLSALQFGRVMRDVFITAPASIFTYVRINICSNDASTDFVLLCSLVMSFNLRRFCRQGLGIFLFAIACRPALGVHPASSPMGNRGLSLGVKRPGREADHSHSSGADVKNAWIYTSPVLRHEDVLSECRYRATHS